MKLNKEELNKIKISVDPVGSVFEYQNSILRAINFNSKGDIIELLNSGLIDELNRKGLFPKTKITDYEIDGYSLVLSHEKIGNWNYPYEWSFGMLKKAAKTVIEINAISNKYGYEIYDCHSNNIVFKNTSPIYFDLGSFKATSNVKNWSGSKFFYSSYYIPLKLHSLGYVDTSSKVPLGVDYFNEVEFLKICYPFIPRRVINIYVLFKRKSQGIRKLTDEEIISRYRNKYYIKLLLLIKSIVKNNGLTNFKALRLIESLKPYNSTTMWGNYHSNLNPKSSKRFNRILEIIKSLEGVNSIIELAANQGKFSTYILENTSIDFSIATDYDSKAIDTMLLNNKNNSRLLPLLLNFMLPSGKIIDVKVENRLSGDISIALAITHHLLLTQNWDIDNVFDQIKKFTKKYVIIEFMPMGLYAGELSNTPNLPDYYNINWFTKKFKKHFEYILDEKLEQNRHVFVGKIKSHDKENN